MKKILFAILLTAICPYPARALCSDVTLTENQTDTSAVPMCDSENFESVGLDVSITGTASVNVLCKLTDNTPVRTITKAGDLPLTSSALVIISGLYSCKQVGIAIETCTGCTVTAICKRCKRAE